LIELSIIFQDVSINIFQFLNINTASNNVVLPGFFELYCFCIGKMQRYSIWRRWKASQLMKLNTSMVKH